jgi:hypothetical protein
MCEILRNSRLILLESPHAAGTCARLGNLLALSLGHLVPLRSQYRRSDIAESPENPAIELAELRRVFGTRAQAPGRCAAIGPDPLTAIREQRLRMAAVGGPPPITTSTGGALSPLEAAMSGGNSFKFVLLPPQSDTPATGGTSGGNRAESRVIVAEDADTAAREIAGAWARGIQISCIRSHLYPAITLTQRRCTQPDRHGPVYGMSRNDVNETSWLGRLQSTVLSSR